MKNMREHNSFKKVLAMMMACMLMLATMNFAFAASVDDYIEGDASWSDVTPDDLSQYITKNRGDWDWKSSLPSSAVAKDDGGTVDLADTEYTVKCKGTDVHITENGYTQLKTLVKSTADAEKAKNKVNAIGTGLDFTPDIDGANNMLQGFMDPLRLFVGIILTVVMVAATFFTASDFLYMTIPFLREKCDNAAASNSRLGTQSQGSGMRPRWVTDEAYASVQEATTNGKNMYWTYISKRGVALIFQGIAIYILCTGNIMLVSQVLINILGGLFGALSSLAG